MKRYFLTMTLAVLFTSPVSAQHAHAPGGLPSEIGQSTFAAIAEIVEILTNDPGTDWSAVNITALRDHLVDMDRVTTQATIIETRKEDQVVFNVSGEEGTVLSIQRMTNAHASMLAGATGWSVSVADTPNGVELSIKGNSASELSKIEALGFFGVMTIGAHHQQHHLMIASGHDPH